MSAAVRAATLAGVKMSDVEQKHLTVSTRYYNFREHGVHFIELSVLLFTSFIFKEHRHENIVRYGVKFLFSVDGCTA